MFVLYALLLSAVRSGSVEIPAATAFRVAIL